MICPRCRQERQERFYGPCSTCRAELRAVVAWPYLATREWLEEHEAELS